MRPLLWSAPALLLLACLASGGIVSPPSGCELSDLSSDEPFSLERCVREPAIDWGALRNRTIFFLGNSVLRHYSFVLPRVLDSLGSIGTIGAVGAAGVSREMEKTLCVGLLNSSSCDHVTANGDTTVRFMWKNGIGQDEPLHDDSGRDICGGGDERTCLERLFANATARDVLVIGSFPLDGRAFARGGFSSLAKPFQTCSAVLKAGLTAELVLGIVRNVLAAFPGTVLWTTYPHWRGDKRTDACYRKVFGLVQRAIGGAAEQHSDLRARVAFVNLYPIQLQLQHLYADLIHHPGALSEYIVKLLFLRVQ